MDQAYLLGGSNDGLWEDIEDGAHCIGIYAVGAFAPHFLNAQSTEPLKEIYSDIGAPLEFRIFTLDGAGWTADTAAAEVARRKVAEARSMTETELVSIFDQIRNGSELTLLEKAALDQMELRGIEA